MKNKKFVILLILVLILIICFILIAGVLFPSRGSNYGNRLDGIDKVKFNKESKNKIVTYINSNEKVKETKIIVHGKIINVIFDVNKDVSVDDARNIANDSLVSFSKKVKEFYDIQYMVTKSDEEGTKKEVVKDDGSTTTIEEKEFPIMGYKNSSNEAIVW